MANIRKDSKGRGLHLGEQQRKEDGIYLYRYTDIAGKRKTIYASDLPELRQKEKQLQKDLDNNILADMSIKKMTLNELFDRYISAKPIAESSKSSYMNMWNNHVKEGFGCYKVIQIKPSHIKAFYMTLSNEGYSHNTIKLIHNMIYPSLEMAVGDDIIPKNPAKNALLSSYGTKIKDKDALTPLQQQRLLTFVETSNIYKIYMPMLTILLETGLRCGELIGLTWNDVSLKDGIISINHQLIYMNFGDGCKFHITAPKTDSGIRDIPMTDRVKKAFLEQKKINLLLGRHNTEEIDGVNDFVFITKTNRPYMPVGINHVLNRIVEAYNKKEVTVAKKEHRSAILLPKFSVHVLRHTACTNRARQGMNIKVLQYLMGHSDSSITLDVYNHLDNISDVRDEIDRCDRKQNFA